MAEGSHLGSGVLCLASSGNFCDLEIFDSDEPCCLMECLSVRACWTFTHD